MSPCKCANPISSPHTLTMYTPLPVIYTLCATCGLPIRLSGMPAELRRLQINRYAMRRTSDHV